MSDPKSIHRVESIDEDTVRVVTKDWMNLADSRKKSVLAESHPDMFVAVQGRETALVGTAAHAGETDGWHIHGANGIVAEVPLMERDLTDAEIEWCEDTFMYGGNNLPDSVIEFEMPHPEDIRAAILEQRLDAFDCLTAVIEDHDRRDEILSSLQKRYEENALRKVKLHSWRGYPIDMDPEWDPDNDHNDDREQETLKEMAAMRADAHRQDFDDIAGFSYAAFKHARARVLDWYEPRVDLHQLVALDVAGADGFDYCQHCAGVLPEEQFLHVQLRGRDEGRTRRVCDDCVEADIKYGGTSDFTVDSLAAARDERALELGGQRRLHSNYAAIATEAPVDGEDK